MLVLDEVDVENACVFIFGVMYSIHSDDVYELLELPADEQIDAVFAVAPLMKEVLGWCKEMRCWGDLILVIFFIRAVFVGFERVEQVLVKLKISGGDVDVVILLDVSVHKVRLKVVLDFGILAVCFVHVSCPHWIDYATESGGMVEWEGDVGRVCVAAVGGRHVVDGKADSQFFVLELLADINGLGCHSFDHVEVVHVIGVEVVVGDFAFFKVAVSIGLVFDD